MIQDLGWWKSSCRDWYIVALPNRQIQTAWSASVMSPPRLAHKEPILCDFSALNMAGYRCFSGVRYWTRGRKEKVTWLTNFFTGLDPDGCLVADQRKVYATHLKYREQRNQRGLFRTGWWPCKKLHYFCDGQVFFIDRGLLMGALIAHWRFLQVWKSNRKHFWPNQIF